MKNPQKSWKILKTFKLFLKFLEKSWKRRKKSWKILILASEEILQKSAIQKNLPLRICLPASYSGSFRSDPGTAGLPHYNRHFVHCRNRPTSTIPTAPSAPHSKRPKPSKCGRPAAREPPTAANPWSILKSILPPPPPPPTPAVLHRMDQPHVHPRGMDGPVGSKVYPTRWRWLRVPTTSTSKRNRPLVPVSFTFK